MITHGVLRCATAAVAGFLSLLAAPAAAAPADLTQPCARAIEVAPGAGERIIGIRLDSAVYADSGAALEDLRLVAGDDREVPYALETLTETTTRTVRDDVAVSLDSVRETGSNALEVVWSPVRPANALPPVVRGFAVETPLRNFERRFSVQGLEGTDWRPLLDDGLLYDYTRYMDVRGLEAALPANRATQFRVRIENIADSRQSPFTEIVRRVGPDEQADGRSERTTLETRPLRIDRIRAWSLRDTPVEGNAVLTDYGEMPFVVEDDAARKQTVVTASSHREPLSQVTLSVDSRNFSRRAELQTPRVEGVRTDWRTVSEATLSVLAFGAVSEKHLTFHLDARRYPKYRIVIHNGDSPPLKVTAVTGRGITQRLLFLHGGAAPLRLVYGGRDVAAPEYDTAGVLTAIRRSARIEEARLGPAQGRASTRTGLSWKRVLNSPVFFGVIVVLAVVVVAAGMLKAIRQNGSDPSGGENPP